MLEKYLMDYKQLLDKVSVITRIIKIEVGVMIMLFKTLIILDITKAKSNNCFIICCTEKMSCFCFFTDGKQHKACKLDIITPEIMHGYHT